MMGESSARTRIFLSEISMVYCYVVGIPAAVLLAALAASDLDGDDVVIEAGPPGEGLLPHPHPRGGGTWWLWG
jgi:hypothetical protein